MVKYHGGLKQVNQGIPYIYDTQYMKKHGLPQFTMYCHSIIIMVYHVIPRNMTKYHGISCNFMVYFQNGFQQTY